MKKISKKRVRDINGLREEVEFMKRFDHPNIVKLYETFEDKSHLYLIMEFCEGGEVLEKLQSMGGQGGMSEIEVGYVMRQVFRAVHYLHLQNTAHRDLKMENMLLVRKGVGCHETPVKIIDFGLAKRVPPNGLTEQKGTKWYLAPELLAGDHYGVEVDIWACGIIMFMLLSSMPPFYKREDPHDDEATYEAIQKQPLRFPSTKWKKRSNGCQALIKQLLNRDTKRRLTAAQAIKDKWLNEIAPAPFKHPLTSKEVENLTAFFHQKRLTQATYELIVLRIAERKIKPWKDLFLTVDKEGTGAVDHDSLKIAMIDAGLQNTPAGTELLSLMNQRGRALNYTEFLAASIDTTELINPDYLKAAFRVFDRNMDGDLDAEELKVIFPVESLSGQGIESVGLVNGRLSFKDYCSLNGLDGDPGVPYVMDAKTRNQLAAKQAAAKKGDGKGCCVIS